MPPIRYSNLPVGAAACLLLLLLLNGCARSSKNTPYIEITNIPPAQRGGGPEMDLISGRVQRTSKEQRVVLYARSGAWYVQPYADQPFTEVNADDTWSSSTHLGTEYAALVVEPGYAPSPWVTHLPTTGEGVLAIAVVEGRPPFWRSWWFLSLLALAGVAALLAFYRWRLHQVSQQLNMRFEARLAERTRIAQDLHDTLSARSRKCFNATSRC